MMLKRCLSALVWLGLAWLPLQQAVAREWASPDGRAVVRFVPEETGAGVLNHLYIGNQKLEAPADSPVRRENHGMAWLENAEGNWVDNRYLVFADDRGLCLVDVQNRNVLLNQTFTGYSKAPDTQEWAAIRYRPTARDQEQLLEGDTDTLWIIRPESLAIRRGEASEERPFAHVDSVALKGLALGRPVWTDDGKGVVVALYEDGKLVAVLLDAKTRQRLAAVPLDGLRLSKAQILSPWFSEDVESLVRREVAASGLLKASAGRARAEGGGSAPTSGGDSKRNAGATGKGMAVLEERPAMMWAVVAGAALAAVGLLWLLLKGRKR